MMLNFSSREEEPGLQINPGKSFSSLINRLQCLVDFTFWFDKIWSHFNCIDLGELTALPDLQNHEERLLEAESYAFTLRLLHAFACEHIHPISLHPLWKRDGTQRYAGLYLSSRQVRETTGPLNPVLHEPLLLLCFSPFNLPAHMHIVVPQLQELKQPNNYRAVSWQSNSRAQGLH